MAIFARIGRLVRGFFGLFISGLEEKNPEALMDAAKQDFRNKMALYNRPSPAWPALPSDLKSQIKLKTDKAEELERRIWRITARETWSWPAPSRGNSRSSRPTCSMTPRNFRTRKTRIRTTCGRRSWRRRNSRTRFGGWKASSRRSA